MKRVAPTIERIALGTGLTYSVRRWQGTPDGNTVVLVHGFLDVAASWDIVAAALHAAAPSTTIIAPDLRGHGDSDRIGPGGYYHFFDYVADLDALLDELGASSVDLVGHSMGGTVCGYYSGTRPNNVRKLALLEGLGPPEAPRDGNALPARAATWLDGWRRVSRSPAPTLRDLSDASARLRKHDPLLDEAGAQVAAEQATTIGAHGALRWKHDPLHQTRSPTPFRRDQAEPFWRAITAPVLLVDGALSTFRLPADDDAARRACLPGAQHQILDGAGHMMMRHRPLALADALNSFFAAT